MLGSCNCKKTNTISHHITVKYSKRQKILQATILHTLSKKSGLGGHAGSTVNDSSEVMFRQFRPTKGFIGNTATVAVFKLRSIVLYDMT